jgi:PUA domain
VVIDRRAGEAVLRGAQLFSPGVLACSAGLERGDEVTVAVAVEERGRASAGVPRGTVLPVVHGPDRTPGAAGSSVHRRNAGGASLRAPSEANGGPGSAAGGLDPAGSPEPLRAARDGDSQAAAAGGVAAALDRAVRRAAAGGGLSGWGTARCCDHRDRFRMLLLVIEEGPNALFCMPNRAHCLRLQGQDGPADRVHRRRTCRWVTPRLLGSVRLASLMWPARFTWCLTRPSFGARPVYPMDFCVGTHLRRPAMSRAEMFRARGVAVELTQRVFDLPPCNGGCGRTDRQTNISRLHGASPLPCVATCFMLFSMQSMTF